MGKTPLSHPGAGRIVGAMKVLAGTSPPAAMILTSRRSFHDHAQPSTQQPSAASRLARRLAAVPPSATAAAGTARR